MEQIIEEIPLYRRHKEFFMIAEEILTQAKADTGLPHGWVVFPLLRDKIIVGLIGWVFGVLLGLGLFAFVSSIVIPYNYERGPLPAVVTTILLGILLFVGLGSAWTFISDIRRLRNREKHLIVITPEDFVKQEGDKIIHVPLINIRHVTARGAPPPEQNPEEGDISRMPSSGENMVNHFLGRAFSPSGMKARRKRMRTPTTLAFVDTRDDQEVTVVTDSAYGDPFAIAAVLKQYAAAVQQLV
jgi:hypothetical protein